MHATERVGFWTGFICLHMSELSAPSQTTLRWTPNYPFSRTWKCLFVLFARVSVCVAGKSPSQQFTALIHVVSPLQSQISPVVKLIIAVAKSKFCAQVATALASPAAESRSSSSKHLAISWEISLSSLKHVPCFRTCLGLNDHQNEYNIHERHVIERPWCVDAHG